MNKKYVLNELTGTMFPENNCTVIHKGKIKIDGIERYASILKYTNPTGEDKLELSISAGLIRLNPQEEKRDPETSPDIQGAITFNNIAYKFGAYQNISEKGVEWIKIYLREKLMDGGDITLNENEKDDSAPF
jgi:hypothetical protein